MTDQSNATQTGNEPGNRRGLEVGGATGEGIDAILESSPGNARQVFTFLIRGWRAAGLRVYAKTKTRVHLRLDVPNPDRPGENHTFALATLVAPAGKRPPHVRLVYPLTYCFEKLQTPRVYYEHDVTAVPGFRPAACDARIVVDDSFTVREAETLLKAMLKLARAATPATLLTEGLPAWAGMFSAAEYEEFRGIVNRYAETHAQSTTVKDGDVFFDGCGVNLTKPARLCRRKPSRERPAVIAEYFDLLKESRKESGELDRNMGNFDRVRTFLSATLRSEEALKAAPEGVVVSRRTLAGTVATLVYDLPSSIRPVKPEEASRWGKKPKELFALAFTNVFDRYEPEISVVQPIRRCRIYVLRVHNGFGAGFVYALKRFPELIGRMGSIVAVPTRNTVLCCPVPAVPAVLAAHTMIPLILHLQKKEPGLSRHLYWYRDDTFSTILYNINDKEKRIELVLPAELVSAQKAAMTGDNRPTGSKAPVVN